jgi:hypothetical protein
VGIVGLVEAIEIYTFLIVIFAGLNRDESAGLGNSSSGRHEVS